MYYIAVDNYALGISDNGFSTICFLDEDLNSKHIVFFNSIEEANQVIHYYEDYLRYLIDYYKENSNIDENEDLVIYHMFDRDGVIEPRDFDCHNLNYFNLKNLETSIEDLKFIYDTVINFFVEIMHDYWINYDHTLSNDKQKYQVILEELENPIFYIGGFYFRYYNLFYEGKPQSLKGCTHIEIMKYLTELSREFKKLIDSNESLPEADYKVRLSTESKKFCRNIIRNLYIDI